MRAPVLEVEHLVKSFTHRGTKTNVVKGVSITLNPKDILALLGPNGAGKTTVTKMISGLIHPDQGTVKICGNNPLTGPAALRQLGVVLEGNRNLYWKMTALENIEYFGVLRGLQAMQARKKAYELLTRFNLSLKKSTLVESLSRGMQQKVAISAALVHNPTLLLLDEPTLGLDLDSLEEMKSIMKDLAAEGKAILVTTHQMDVAQAISNRTVIMKEGLIIAEDLTSDIIQKFSGNSYTLELNQELPVHLLESISALGSYVTGKEVRFRGGTESLWRNLDLLRNLPIERLYKDDSDLTAVFKKLTKGTSV